MIKVNPDAVEIIGPERTMWTPLVPIGGEHKVIDDELAPVFEKLGRRLLPGILDEKRFGQYSPLKPLHLWHRTGGTSPPQESMDARRLLSITLLAWAVPFGPLGFKSSPWMMAHQACLLPM